VGRILKLLLAALALVAVAYGVADFFFPARFAAAALAAQRSAAGLQRKEIDIPGQHIVYLEGGQGQPLLLLHGFGADKDNWARIALYLTSRYRVIAPDLPGYGESSHPAPEQARIEDQLRYLNQFAAALKLERFDLGGNSMGGWISAAYAAAHPEQVNSLWLLAPAGLSTAQPSDLIQIVRSGGHPPLIARTPHEFEQLLDFVFVHRPWVPRAVIGALAQRAVQNAAYDQKIFDELVKDPALEPQVQGLGTPTLIVWGDHDRALHYSGAEVLHGLMPHSQVVIMADIGHLPMMEAPSKAAADYVLFRDSLGKH
jgi:abhydrolase domain-containing protein 6